MERVSLSHSFTLLPFLVEGLHIVHPHTEDEEVSLPGFLGHLHVGSIHGTDGEGAVQHELHVAGSRGFSAGCGDLLRQIGRWDD